tara:strand:- start:166 stop:897 length:732 start_codon:yes stop_codon:yes gene_type:complete
MARTGVLSDIAVKFRNPEWFPLDLGGQELIHPINLQKHIFTGIKPPKRIKRYNNVSRFPVNDLKNFATFGSRGREKQAELNAIMNYRKELGSNNFSPNLETAYAERINAGFTPAPMFRPDTDNNLMSAPATLTLNRMFRKEAQDTFSQNVPASRSLLSARMRATLANSSNPEDYDVLTSYIIPGGIPQKVDDETALAKLSDVYKGDPEQLGVLERAYHAAGKQNLLPMGNDDQDDYVPFDEEN